MYNRNTKQIILGFPFGMTFIQDKHCLGMNELRDQFKYMTNIPQRMAMYKA